MYTLPAGLVHRQNFRLQRAREYGHQTGRKIAREWEDLDIDVVIPIPETSCDIALEIARILGKPYRRASLKPLCWPHLHHAGSAAAS